MKVLLLGLLITQMSLAAEEKPLPRWNQLMTLVQKEMKILENTRRKNQDLQYRLLELHSEKLKLIHEKNNRDFLTQSVKAGQSQNRDAIFAESRAYYEKTKAFGHQLLKDYPNSPHKADTIFVLALNSRDYGSDNITEKYLLQSISLVKDSSSSLRHHAETALADFYYNSKNYDQAISYYQRSIRLKEDTWLPKHHFNLSWCYLKTRNFDLAISTINEAYVLSKNAFYVNIKDQVLENIGAFYVYAGRPLDGLDFYLRNEKDAVVHLLSLAAKASNKGHQKETETILAATQGVVDKNNWEKYQEEVYHAYLDFYRHYNRFGDMDAISEKVVAYYARAAAQPKDTRKEVLLPVAMREDAVEKLRSVAGYLQVKLAKDIKQDSKQLSAEELRTVLSFFEHLIKLDSERKDEYVYFRAETLYSVKRFSEAAQSYEEAVKVAKLLKKPESARKSLNSLLALTGLEVLEKPENKKFLIFAYSEHIYLWPRDEMTEKIYPKLFEIYLEDYDHKKSTGVLRLYNKYYPEHLKSQQDLMTRVLDQFIDKKNTERLAFWIHKFKAGFLSLTKETIEKTEIVLGNILFIQYQEMAKRGDRLAAAKGFEEIYVNKLYTDKVKYQSAFFAALAYLDMGETRISYNWQELSHARMTEEEKLEKRVEQLKISERMYKLQDFATSYKLSHFLLKTFCPLKDETQNRLYQVAVMTALVEEKPSDAEMITKDFSKCLSKPELKDQALSQIYAHYEKFGEIYNLRKFVQRHSVEPYLTQYRYTLQKWYWERSNLTLKEHILTEFKALKNEETKTWLAEILSYQKARKEMDELKAEAIWTKPSFDGDEFNKALEGYILKVTAFKDRYQALTQSSQIDLAIISTRLFSEVYLHVGEKIQGLKPSGMDPAILPDFQGAMKQVSGQFLSASRQYDKQLVTALRSKETMAWGARSIASVEDVENPVFSFFTGLPMDRGQDK